ncbi:MAG: hypothetical protein ABH950_00330 [Candidatus Altiarchaeota archaeon]
MDLEESGVRGFFGLYAFFIFIGILMVAFFYHLSGEFQPRIMLVTLFPPTGLIIFLVILATVKKIANSFGANLSTGHTFAYLILGGMFVMATWMLVFYEGDWTDEDGNPSEPPPTWFKVVFFLAISIGFLVVRTSSKKEQQVREVTEEFVESRGTEIKRETTDDDRVRIDPEGILEEGRHGSIVNLVEGKFGSRYYYLFDFIPEDKDNSFETVDRASKVLVFEGRFPARLMTMYCPFPGFLKEIFEKMADLFYRQLEELKDSGKETDFEKKLLTLTNNQEIGRKMRDSISPILENRLDQFPLSDKSTPTSINITKQRLFLHAPQPKDQEQLSRLIRLGGDLADAVERA